MGLSSICSLYRHEFLSNFILFLILVVCWRVAEPSDDFFDYDSYVNCYLIKPSVSMVFIALHEAAQTYDGTVWLESGCRNDFRAGCVAA